MEDSASEKRKMADTNGQNITAFSHWNRLKTYESLEQNGYGDACACLVKRGLDNRRALELSCVVNTKVTPN